MGWRAKGREATQAYGGGRPYHEVIALGRCPICRVRVERAAWRVVVELAPDAPGQPDRPAALAWGTGGGTAATHRGVRVAAGGGRRAAGGCVREWVGGRGSIRALRVPAGPARHAASTPRTSARCRGRTGGCCGEASLQSSISRTSSSSSSDTPSALGTCRPSAVGVVGWAMQQRKGRRGHNAPCSHALPPRTGRGALSGLAPCATARGAARRLLSPQLEEPASPWTADGERRELPSSAEATCDARGSEASARGGQHCGTSGQGRAVQRAGQHAPRGSRSGRRRRYPCHRRRRNLNRRSCTRQCSCADRRTLLRGPMCEVRAFVRRGAAS